MRNRTLLLIVAIIVGGATSSCRLARSVTGQRIPPGRNLRSESTTIRSISCNSMVNSSAVLPRVRDPS